MKFKVLLIVFTFFISSSAFAQRYGVVDTDYILKSLPEYAQAKSQVDKLSEQWSGEVSALQSELESLKDALDAERILLSPEKLEKREGDSGQTSRSSCSTTKIFWTYWGTLCEAEPAGAAHSRQSFWCRTRGS